MENLLITYVRIIKVKRCSFCKKLYEYEDVHVMQDAQDGRSQICLNYVTKRFNVICDKTLLILSLFGIVYIRFGVLHIC